jgi:hypothetical protein
MEVTAPRARARKVHIIKEGAQSPHCPAKMTANTKIVSYQELMTMERDGRVCQSCLKSEMVGG